jgi:Group 4 capsule polysaccharide lipoprotein gfcB, YjbF
MAGRVQLIRLVRRFLPVALIAAPLLGCGSNSNFDPLRKMLWHDISAIGTAAPGVSRAQAAAVPYATTGVRYGSAQEAMLVLATASERDREWVGGTQFSIITRDGRIIRTVGFPYNLSGFQGPIADSGPDAVPGGYHYLYDFADKHIYGVLVHCVRHDAGLARIDIIGGFHNTRRIVEECTAPQLDWEFQNEFWRDVATGYVWKSVQHIHPDADAFALEVLRPEVQ